MIQMLSQLHSNDRVVYMYLDGPPRDIRKRLDSIGVTKKHDSRIAFARYSFSYNKDKIPDGVVEVLKFLRPADRGIVIIDTVTSASGGTNDSNEYREWHSNHVKHFLAEGYAVILLDHEPKSPDNRTQRGTSAKRDLTRLQYRLYRPNTPNLSLIHI